MMIHSESQRFSQTLKGDTVPTDFNHISEIIDFEGGK